jgi:predicted DCC family thiol-disulfide oxidoreductase YuxK
MDKLSVRRPIVLYDGQCGLCRWGVSRIDGWLGRPADLVPYQAADLTEVGLDSVEAARALHFVCRGQVCAGSRAVSAWIRSSPRIWRVLGYVADWPGVRAVAELAYGFVSKNRSRLPGPWSRPSDLEGRGATASPHPPGCGGPSCDQTRRQGAENPGPDHSV